MSARVTGRVYNRVRALGADARAASDHRARPRSSCARARWAWHGQERHGHPHDAPRGRGTRAARNELREKVAEHPEHLATPSTVHSFSIATLLANEGTSGLPEPIRLADDWEWSELIRQHLKVLVDCDVRMIDRARAEMASNWESLEPAEDPDLPDDVRNRFAGIWEHHRRIYGYSLLAELPFRLLRALEDHPDLNIGDWAYLVVDEYQDLNQCDLSVLGQITHRSRVLVATGDDDQSIYSFRRAHPIGIRRFVTDDYPEAADLTLTVSQRCATHALAWARHVIEGLPGRLPRPALTPAAHCVEGVACYLRFPSWPQEADGVARLAKWLIDNEGVAPEDIAVMFRSNFNNAWSTPLTERLEHYGVPVINAGAVAEMLADAENQRLLALARLVVNREDSLAWWTLLHLPPGIGPVVRDHFYDGAEQQGRTFASQLVAEHAAGFPDLGGASATRVRNTVNAAIAVIDAVDLEGADLGDAGWGEWLVAKADSPRWPGSSSASICGRKRCATTSRPSAARTTSTRCSTGGPPDRRGPRGQLYSSCRPWSARAARRSTSSLSNSVMSMTSGPAGSKVVQFCRSSPCFER